MTGFTRRQALLRLANGVGGIGLAAYLSEQGSAGCGDGRVEGKRPHHRRRRRA